MPKLAIARWRHHMFYDPDQGVMSGPVREAQKLQKSGPVRRRGLGYPVGFLLR